MERRRRATGNRRVLLPLLLVALSACGQPAADASKALRGTQLGGRPAPSFQLTDQVGRKISLTDFRGQVVIVTFFYTHCPDICPLTAEKLRRVVRELGTEGRQVMVLGVSTDPQHDTPASARRFLREHGVPSRWHFLLGNPYDLAVVWSKYHVYAGTQAKNGVATVLHTAGMVLVDQQGRERVYIDDRAPASDILWDIRQLLSSTAA